MCFVNEKQMLKHVDKNFIESISTQSVDVTKSAGFQLKYRNIFNRDEERIAALEKHFKE